MAIISTLDKMEKFFSDNNLYELYVYLIEALNVESNIHNKMINMNIDTFEKDTSIKTCNIFHQCAITKKREDCFIESHKKYVDFQLIVNGIEQMEYVDINRLSVKKDYDESKDLIIYDNHEMTSKFLLQKGDIAIFFPEDAHVGQSMYSNEALINKIVVKVPLSFFNIG